jgi:hypothetical protein
VPDGAKCGVDIRTIDVFECGIWNGYNGLAMFKYEKVPHNVDNCAYHIHGHGWKAFYVTDANDISHIEAKDYDLYLVEANHTEAEILERIRTKQETGEYCYEWDALRNHLSIDKALNWLYANMGSFSKYVLLHQHEGLNL